MGRLRWPLMLVVREDDQNWATVESAKDIAQMMRAAGNEHLLTILLYPDAGHLIELPCTHPTSEPLQSQQLHSASNTTESDHVVWGGYPKQHANAQEDSREKSLGFLRQHLYPSHDSVAKAKL
ncbi:peroxisomal succinyl-coenzyme A thioesterase-like [Salvelinus fontinalis]|uniref:peroxisomal succinyl-coenzyme A thioesterase-like n=1 Tax=Salvelinus fontinalis TaxID=8038 RepID=UPI0024866C63|nr:peroxisomal succinyl-coenzyme A thioesterase-like [Salvelinus fontinalis]XP_055793983.1 peroxisomal succinyl-coenzyme A thioesterase-like [Salvelinus fontinalis]